MNNDPSMPRANILIVDDTPANLRLLSQMLADQGYKVRPVPHGALALKAVKAAPPDLILLDIKMPGMDGYQVCKLLKADPKMQNIPIIFISALDEVQDKVKAFTVGGVDYVTKPFHFEEVLARVETHLTLAYLQKQLQAYNEKLEHLVQVKVTELEQERAITVQLDKMAALGQMATGVAHELNQPLAAMSFEADYLKMLAKKSKDEPNSDTLIDLDELHEVGENLMADVARCRRITDHLRTFGRASSGDLKAVNLNRPIQDSLILTEARLRNHGIDVNLLLNENLPPVMADAHKLEQVFLNLISNAEYALHVKTEALSCHPILEIKTFIEGDNVIATVYDNGCGIPKEAQAHIFEPFFTSKPEGEGTGLGLSISYGIVTEFKGKISFESVENEGTTFRLEFPRLPDDTPEEDT